MSEASTDARPVAAELSYSGPIALTGDLDGEGFAFVGDVFLRPDGDDALVWFVPLDAHPTDKRCNAVRLPGAVPALAAALRRVLPVAVAASLTVSDCAGHVLPSLWPWV